MAGRSMLPGHPVKSKLWTYVQEYLKVEANVVFMDEIAS